MQLAEPSGGGGGGGKVDGIGCLDAAGQASWGSKLMQLHWSLQVATGWGGGGGIEGAVCCHRAGKGCRGPKLMG